MEEIFTDFHDLSSMFPTKRDCQLVQVLMFVVVFAPYLSREQGGCLSSSLLLSLILMI